MVLSAPGFILAPDINLEVTLDNFEATNIPDTVWETVSIDIPVEPIISFPNRPEVVDPEQPVAPEITLDEFTPPQLQSLEVETNCQERVDIAVPGPLNLREWTEGVPEFDRPVPTGEVDWEYEEFSRDLTQVLLDKYDLLILPTEYYSRLQQRNQAIWDNEQDWVVQRGQDNTYLSRKNKELSKGIHNFNTFVVIENYKSDIILKKLFINARQTHEQILRQHHDVKQKLNFKFVTAVMQNSIKHWNACIQKLNAQIETYRELARVYTANITRQNILLEELQSRVRISEGLSQYNTAVLQRINAQVNTQKGVISFFQSQMSLAKAELRVELLQAQVERLEIQIFAELNRALVDRAQQDIVEQEAEIAKTKVIKLEAIKQRLEAEIETAQVDLQSARDKFAGDQEAFLLTQESRREEHEGFEAAVEAREDVQQRTALLDQARGFFTKQETEADVEQIELRQARLDGKYERDIAEATSTAKINLLIAEAESILADGRVAAREAVKVAELDAQRSLAASDITQSLVHQLAEG